MKILLTFNHLLFFNFNYHNVQGSKLIFNESPLHSQNNIFKNSLIFGTNMNYSNSVFLNEYNNNNCEKEYNQSSNRQDIIIQKLDFNKAVYYVDQEKPIIKISKSNNHILSLGNKYDEMQTYSLESSNKDIFGNKFVLNNVTLMKDIPEDLKNIFFLRK